MVAKRTQGHEFAWIEWMRGLEGTPDRREFPLAIGDDAAVWVPSRGRAAVLTVDAQVEGVHFRRSWMSMGEIGRRAVVASVSDLAAMGARPRVLLASTVLPSDTSTRDFRALHAGIHDSARAYSATLLGGNLSAGPLAVHVAAIGDAPPERLLKRSGARLGDSIWVTGSPGLARLGLGCLLRQDGVDSQRLLKSRGVRRAIRAFVEPRARVAEGLHLAGYRSVGGAIDLSDGLVSDLKHVLRESSRVRGQSLGAELDATALLKLPGLVAASRSLETDALEAALYGGEAYELCFTATSSFTPRLAGRFERKFGTRLTCIGRVTSQVGIGLVRADGTRTDVISDAGWDHFG